MQLVLAEGRAVELGFDVRAEVRVRERARQMLRQGLGFRLELLRRTAGQRARRAGCGRGRRSGGAIAARERRHDCPGGQGCEIARFMKHG